MNEQKTLDYARIAQAIGYIRENFKGNLDWMRLPGRWR